MSDLQDYIKQRKARDAEFANGFDSGYEQFKIRVLLKQAENKMGRENPPRVFRVGTCQSSDQVSW